MFFSLKHGLAWIKDFFSSLKYLVNFIPILPQMLFQGTGQTLRKDHRPYFGYLHELFTYTCIITTNVCVYLKCVHSILILELITVVFDAVRINEKFRNASSYKIYV